MRRPLQIRSKLARFRLRSLAWNLNFFSRGDLGNMNLARKQILTAVPPQGWLGSVLLAVCWPLNWTLPGMRTAYLFFPLWLGYVLVVDALVLRRTGTSLLCRSPRDFVLLFLVSAPSWWLFEVINWRTHNWEYVGRK